MKIAEPRFENGKAMLIAGLGGHFTDATLAKISTLWQRFESRHLGHVPRQVGKAMYGVCHDFEPGNVFDYIAGVEVASLAGLPAEFAQLRIAPRRYAVFAHAGRASEIGNSWRAIFGEWLPNSGHQFVGDPCYERYDKDFDPKTGLGEMEIWVSLKK